MSRADEVPSRSECEVSQTKVLATLGPASAHEDTIARMVEAGATLFRLNFSHGSLDDHARQLETVRRVSAQLQRPLTVLGDLQGPKLRLRTTPEGGIVLVDGQTVEIRADRETCTDGETPVLASDYAGIVDEVLPGHRVLINDGAVRLLALEIRDGGLFCTVTQGGPVTSRKGINLPDSHLDTPAMTERDWECVRWAVEHDLDFLALSFVRTPEEIEDLRVRLTRVCVNGRCGSGLDEDDESRIPIIAKIETPQAVERIEEIIRAADGVMVARGDLGVEIELARVPMVQKRLVAAAHTLGKPCIVATQMLESMIERPIPTRAEVSDVANAILDGADCVMLSGETAVGAHPVLAVETIKRVALAVEEDLRAHPQPSTVPEEFLREKAFIPALTHGAWQIAMDIGATAIVIWSQSGGAARMLSRQNFYIPILAFSSDDKAVRRMNLLYAVHPILCPEVPSHRSEFAELADRALLDQGWVERGDPIVLIAGKPLDAPGSTNTVAIRRAGSLAGGD